MNKLISNNEALLTWKKYCELKIEDANAGWNSDSISYWEDRLKEVKYFLGEK